MRVIARSGQGLAGMAEEFDELTSKIFKDELKEGIMTKIVDDCYIGGETQEETARNYERVLHKLHKANLKITPDKTHIFPKQADVLGWIWNEGGYLKASPHRKLAITNTRIEDIKKVKDMRSWIGLFKTLHMATPHISPLLAPFEEATAGKESSEHFIWDYELERKFRNAKEQIDKLVTLYLPTPDDQLVLQTDASKKGLGHILFAIKNAKKHPVRIHSVKLPDKCRNWCPCEVEGLGLAVGIDKEYDLIRESKLPLIIESDSKPVDEALKLINQGKFSTSARMSSILTNMNRTPIKSRHISGKAMLNPIADLQSRTPPICTSEFCSVRKFLQQTTDSILEDGPKLGALTINAEGQYANRNSWNEAQKANQACRETKKLLSSGKPPPKPVGKYAGEYWNDIRRYYRECSIASDGLLVVKSEAEAISGNISREKIVIPKPLVPALLYHLHNNRDQHPTRSQQKAQFQRQFFAINLEKNLDLLYSNCYKCSILEKIPKEAIRNESQTDVDRPQVQFHVDVIKRAKQNILIVRDHFSSYQDALLIQSEKATDLKEGIITLTSTMRRPGEIYVSADNAPGFKPLLNNTDEDLQKLKITMVKTDELNKNSNAVVDKACQELEEELKRLEPEGTEISNTTLKLAVLNLNAKLRRRGNISAFELSHARDQNTGKNLAIDDRIIRENQLMKREDRKTRANQQQIHVGDTVKLKNRHDKHKASEIFLVTDKKDENVTVQKLIHPLKSNAKIMSKPYLTKQKLLIPIHHPLVSKCSNDEPTINNKQRKHNNTWNPFNSEFYLDAESDIEEEATQCRQIVKTERMRDTDEAPNLSASEVEYEWDDSPEQFELINTNHQMVETTEEETDEVLMPRQLFSYDSDKDSNNSHRTEGIVRPRLQRSNAMRRKRLVIGHSIPKRRYGRRRSSDNDRQIRSQPTTPTDVQVDVVQNLNFILQPNNPIVPEAVQMDATVQRYERALQEGNVRRSARIQAKAQGQGNAVMNYKEYDANGSKGTN